MSNEWDFSGWATRNDLLCSDGRVIRKNAFRDQDGETVPLFWDHQHNNIESCLGHALLENRDEGVYAYCKFNDTEDGQIAKKVVQHGDIKSLSIFAGKLKEVGKDVVHGIIREVSLVTTGANPGATVDFVMAHGEDGSETLSGVEACYDENIMLYHSDKDDKDEENKDPKKKDDADSNKKENTESEASDNGGSASEKKADGEKEKDETVQDIIDTMNEKQKDVLDYLVGIALDSNGNTDEKENDDNENEGGDNMKHNVFENDGQEKENFLSHADQETIMTRARKLGSFQAALDEYAETNSLKHGFSDYTKLFPENAWENTPGAPGKIDKDETWVDIVLNKVGKSPISRVRSRYIDLRPGTVRGLGYTKGQQKKLIGQFDMIGRSHDPQTIYVKEQMHRDDILDIVDFDVVSYVQSIMRDKLNLEIAMAIMVGDGRSNSDTDKIKPEHVRPVWGDADLYTIVADVDVDAAKEKLNGESTKGYFGDNYVYAEAIIEAALYAREKYKGSGSLDFFCTPHLLNVMLLARDMNGRRIYNSKADLAAALNVNEIYTVEQFEGKTRTDDSGKTKKLLGLFYNLGDYQIGSVKGGEITNFEDFDIDYNQYKYLMETRISGANTKVFSAIALEEVVAKSTESADDHTEDVQG